MGLFKRFTGSKQASKDELAAFKARLKYGEDPKEMYDTYMYHLKQYMELEKQTNELLVRILKVKTSDKTHNWTKLEIANYSHNGECEKSPISKHIYLHHFGKLNTKSNDDRACLCCGKKL